MADQIYMVIYIGGSILVTSRNAHSYVFWSHRVIKAHMCRKDDHKHTRIHIRSYAHACHMLSLPLLHTLATLIHSGTEQHRAVHEQRQER